jgi:hypothetical protein
MRVQLLIDRRQRRPIYGEVAAVRLFKEKEILRTLSVGVRKATAGPPPRPDKRIRRPLVVEVVSLNKISGQDEL